MYQRNPDPEPRPKGFWKILEWAIKDMDRPYDPESQGVRVYFGGPPPPPPRNFWECVKLAWHYSNEDLDYQNALHRNAKAKNKRWRKR